MTPQLVYTNRNSLINTWYSTEVADVHFRDEKGARKSQMLNACRDSVTLLLRKKTEERTTKNQQYRPNFIKIAKTTNHFTIKMQTCHSIMQTWYFDIKTNYTTSMMHHKCPNTRNDEDLEENNHQPALKYPIGNTH